MNTKPLTIVAVDIRSAHNVGSLFRTADGFSAEIFLVGITPYPLQDDDKRLPHIAKKITQDIHKTALGSETSVRWNRYELFEEAISLLREKGYKIYAIEQTATSRDIESLVVEGPTALVFGREVEGLHDSEIQFCDAAYEIAMTGRKESFNVSVAAGIALYAARSQE